MGLWIIGLEAQVVKGLLFALLYVSSRTSPCVCLSEPRSRRGLSVYQDVRIWVGQ